MLSYQICPNLYYWPLMFSEKVDGLPNNHDHKLLAKFHSGTLTIWMRPKADFLSWQKSLAYSLRIFVNNFSLISTLQRVLAAWLKIFN